MQSLATIDLFDHAAHPDRATTFRARDNFCLSDRRRCLRITGGEASAFTFVLDDAAPPAGTAEIVLEGCLEIHDSHAYVHKHVNSILEIRVNETPVFDGILHWRSHEETVAFWNPHDFPFDASLLREGENTLTIINKTSREALGEFLDPALGDEAAEEKLATLYLAGLEVNFVGPSPEFPAFHGVPETAVAGEPFIVEVSTGAEEGDVSIAAVTNGVAADLGGELEYDEYRYLFEITARTAGEPCVIDVSVDGESLQARVPLVHARCGDATLIAGPGAETTYWHRLKTAVQDVFARGTGNCVRISLDDFLANLHFVPLEKWRTLIAYMVRRRMHFALQRIRVPPYSKIQHEELRELADLGGELFAGISIVEPVLRLEAGDAPPDFAAILDDYLQGFEQSMLETRLGDHPVVTFDAAGGICGHYYRLGLDVHLSELGPACNVYEEACMRGAATAYGKPWGVVAAMQWYFGQGAQYAYDDARVRLAWLTMLSSYLAGARQILWEGACFESLPVYNYLLTEESWRDFGRRYHDAEPAALRAHFRDLLNYHRAQQLPSPRARFAVLQGRNDLFRGVYRNDAGSHDDMSMLRAWMLLKVFLPHVSCGRWGVDHDSPRRRWYSHTPYGQVDVLPEHAASQHYDKYQLLAMLGWNTMEEDLYAKLRRYTESGGTLFCALPHFVADTKQEHEWTFFQDGDLAELCGVRVRDIGSRIETVTFEGDEFAENLPKTFDVVQKNPLWVEDYDERYAVFGIDVTVMAGDLEVVDAEILATSQAGDRKSVV